jgi:raffinose/stachyose/melibiose transport system permease protein
MGGDRKYSVSTLVLEIIAVCTALIFLVPMYFVLVNSVKSFADVLMNTAGWPKEFMWGNYKEAWEIMRYPSAFMNSMIVTVFANLGIIILASMAAYRLVRRPTKWNNLLFALFVSAMVIPFQSIMIPLVKMASSMGLMNSRWGLIIAYFGFGIPLSVFLFHGFVKSVPREIEEAAVVDGCTPYGVFWKIVFPLLKPMAVTILILNSLWIWNDFLLPFLILGGSPELRTIPLSTYSLFGQYTKQWDLAMAALVLGVAPIIVFFLTMQKHVVEGIAAGSVKG